MGFFSFLSFFSRRSKKSSPLRRHRSRPGLEALEQRTTPTCNTISGFVYHDADNDGIFDPGETPLQSVSVALKNASGVTVATATTNAQGYYEFMYDSTVSTAPSTLTKVVEFGPDDTNFDKTGLVDQFDPALGELQAIELVHEGAITSSIRVENTSNSSGSAITATVGGTLTLKAPGVNDVLTISQNVGNFNATLFDGDLHYTGSSGTSFAPSTANGTNTLTLTGGSLAGWVGTGKVTVQEVAIASSNASGGGNLATLISSQGHGKLTVRYKYVPNNCLAPGAYTIHETQPANTLDGKDAINNVPQPGSIGTDVLSVTLGNANLTNNNFGEILAAHLSGFVYHDADNDGARDIGEEAIAAVALSLSGTAYDGQAVNLSTTTDGAGAYRFENLKPGTYTVTEAQPSQYIDGKDTAGSLGGSTATNDQIAGVALPAGGQSVDNNFGELRSSLAGFVYLDANNNGIKEGNEAGITGVPVTLNGFSADGPVSLSTTTDGTGAYRFDNLKPGTYAILEGNPGTQYLDGKDTIGTPGGTTEADTFSNVVLASGVHGVNNNFGELLPAKVSGYVYLDANENGTKDAGDSGIGSVTVSLTGTTVDGQPVNLTTSTIASGYYEFANLKPGTYTITETQPAGYNDAADNLGNRGGTVANDVFNAIALAMAAVGENYNFGEKLADEADLSIAKSASAPQVRVGDALTYSLVITNHGTFTARDVKVVDTLPTGATLLSAAGAGWTVTSAGGVITATLPTLAVGASTTITVTVRVPGIADTLTNTSVVSARTPDNNPNNNSSTVTTPVILPDPGVRGIRTTAVTGGAKSKNDLMSDSKAQGGNANDSTFIDGLFQTLLGRLVDVATQKAYMAQLAKGRTRADVVREVANSDEHRGQVTDETYRTVLGRLPTPAERQIGIEALRAGYSEHALAAYLYDSAEFQGRNARAAELVGSLYAGIVGRLPSQITSQATVQAMDNTPLSQLVQDLQRSVGALRNQVDGVYRSVLGRRATESELATYASQLQNWSLSVAGLRQQLLSSDEFYNRARNARVK